MWKKISSPFAVPAIGRFTSVPRQLRGRSEELSERRDAHRVYLPPDHGTPVLGSVPLADMLEARMSHSYQIIDHHSCETAISIWVPRRRRSKGRCEFHCCPTESLRIRYGLGLLGSSKTDFSYCTGPPVVCRT